MTKSLIAFIVVALLATYTPTAHAAERNACYIAVRSRGQYVVQTAGEAGTINVYVDGNYVTTVSRKNALWYATADKDAVVRGYDSNGVVC